MEVCLLSHTYNIRSVGFRHPLVLCEVERRAIAHELILMNEEIAPNLFEGPNVNRVLKKYKKYLLNEQHR